MILSKIKPVTSYRTSDGLMHTNLPAAADREKWLFFCEWYLSKNSHQTRSIGVDDMFDWLMDARHIIQEIFSAEVEEDGGLQAKGSVGGFEGFDFKRFRERADENIEYLHRPPKYEEETPG